MNEIVEDCRKQQKTEQIQITRKNNDKKVVRPSLAKLFMVLFIKLIYLLLWPINLVE